MLRPILSYALLVLPAMAQFTNPPEVFSVENSASYSGTLAPGSLFVVFGANIGPAQAVQASSLPLAPQLGKTSISVKYASTAVDCPMVYSSTGQAAAVLPSSVPAGQASVSLTYNGQSTSFPFPITVAPSAAGLYAVSSSGLGPGVFTDGSVTKSFALSAKNGEIVTVWATGLGPVSGADNVLPSAFPNFPGVEVFVGSEAANVIYAGRSGCCVGLDQVSFEVPAGVAGCYVPVAVRSGGTISNFVSLAVNSGGGPCSDTAPTIPTKLMNQAIAGQSVKAAALAVGPVVVLRGLGFNEKLYLAAKLSQLLHARVSEGDVQKLLLASQTHNQRALTRVMLKYAASWKASDPGTKAAVKAALNPNQEGAVADFGQFTTPAALAAAVGGLFPSQGTCTAFPSQFVGRSANGLNAGTSLALSGQAGSWTLKPSRTGQYQVLFGNSPIGPNLPPGTYAITGNGGPGLNAFNVTLDVGGNVVWTNKAAINNIDRSQALTVTWSGGTNPGYVLVGSYLVSNTVGLAGFICAEDTTKGSFTIPSFILSLMPPAPTGGTIFISPHPLSRQVTIPGVDLAYFMDGSSDSKSVVYQ